jgi:CRISPR-associated protein Cst1
MWHLNKFVKNVLGKSNAYKLDQILGFTLLEFAQKVFMTLGIWSIMNIEMVINKKDAIDYYSLPLYVMKVLLNKKVANLLNDIGEPSIFEMVISGNFDSLVELNHEVLKSVFDDNFERNKKRYKYVSRLKNTKKRNRQKISAILPELYAQIDSILKLREVKI